MTDREWSPGRGRGPDGAGTGAGAGVGAGAGARARAGGAGTADGAVNAVGVITPGSRDGGNLMSANPDWKEVTLAFLVRDLWRIGSVC